MSAAFGLRGDVHPELALNIAPWQSPCALQALMEQLSRIEAEQQRLLMIQTGGMPGMMMMGGPGGPAMMPGAAPGEPAAKTAFPSLQGASA